MITADLRSSFLGLRVLCLQAPVPYLNRALAEEQLGVDADERNEHQEAQVQYSGAVKVGLCSAWGKESSVLRSRQGRSLFCLGKP